jgi:transcriptional regulator with XRE-family HTH domain
MPADGGAPAETVPSTNQEPQPTSDQQEPPPDPECATDGADTDPVTPLPDDPSPPDTTDPSEVPTDPASPPDGDLPPPADAEPDGDVPIPDADAESAPPAPQPEGTAIVPEAVDDPITEATVDGTPDPLANDVSPAAQGDPAPGPVSEELVRQPATGDAPQAAARSLAAPAATVAPPVPESAETASSATDLAARVSPHLIVAPTRFATSTTDIAPTSAVAVLTTGVAVVAPRAATTTVSVAMDFARLSGWAGPLVFNTWLRRQIRERRMSQRQLGALSGVDHSTISRLLRGQRMPTLETATKLVHALRMEWTDDQVATYFDLLPERTLFPIQRVESALRGDLELGDDDVKAIMDHYLKRRIDRRRVSGIAAPEAAEAAGTGPRARAGPDGHQALPASFVRPGRQAGGISSAPRSARGREIEPEIGIDAGVTGTPARPSSSS